MPDHLHFICVPRGSFALSKWVRYLKWLMSRALKHALWQPDFFDHRIRSASELNRYNDYIWNNPLRAGLVSRAEDWEFSGQVHQLDW